MLTDCESRRARREGAAEESLFNLEGAGDEDCEKKIARGYSSAGRAPALQAGGRRFDPDYLHQKPLVDDGPVAQLARAYD